MAHHDTRVVFVGCYTDIRIALIISHKGVILRTMLLDQVALKNKSFDFGFCNDIFEVRYLRYHLNDFWRVVVSVP